MSSTSFEAYSRRYKETERYVSGTVRSQLIVSQPPLEGIERRDATSLNNEPTFLGYNLAGSFPTTPLPPPAAKLPTHRDTSFSEDTTQNSPFHVALQIPRRPCKADKSKKVDECSQPSTSQRLLKFIGVDDIEKYTPCWPQVAAFQTTNDSLLLFRSFNQLQCRTLQNLQSKISHLEKALQDLVPLDSKSPDMTYRLMFEKHEEGWGATKKEIFRELEKKFQTYNDLLLQNRELTKLRNAPIKTYLNFFNYLWSKQPLEKDASGDWYHHVNDLVMLAESNSVDSTLIFAFNRFKNILPRYIDKLKLYLFHKPPTTLPISKYPPPSRALTTASRATSATLAVGILLIPVFLLLWISMNRFWKSATVSISMMIFAFLMANFPNVGTKDVLLATAAYCAVLATCLGNSQLG